MMVLEFLVLVPSQKHQFVQLSMHKNTFTKAKDSAWGMTAPEWSTEVRKHTLKKVGNSFTLSLFPFPQAQVAQHKEKYSPLPQKEEEWSEHPTSLQIPAPTPGLCQCQHGSHGSKIQNGSYGPRLLAHLSTRPAHVAQAPGELPWTQDHSLHQH